jgi:hypothetical protein
MKQVTIPEPSLDKIRKFELALRMSGLATDLQSVDLLLRTSHAVRVMGGKFDLRTAATLQSSVDKRWRDGTPEVVWECEGFRGFKE